MTEHKQYYALAKKLGWGNDEKAMAVAQYSAGQTESLKELAEKHPLAYREMLAKMRELDCQRPAKPAGKADVQGDMWRKRCIASIGAWLDATGCTPADKMKYIKATACRSAGQDGGQFNQLTVCQLTAVYNSFCRQNETLKRTRELKTIINPNKN